MKVTERDLIGQLEGFPIEIVEKMLLRQFQQHGEENIQVLQQFTCGAFIWNNTEEGYNFWEDIIFKRFFNTFFQKYPKVNNKAYCRGVSNRGEEVIKALEKLGGINTMGCTGFSEGLYYLIGKNSAISTLIVAPITTWLLEQTFTEVFLSGKPRETIIIGGIEYDKQEVENRLKDLQPLK